MEMGNILRNFQKWWRYELWKSLFDRLFSFSTILVHRLNILMQVHCVLCKVRAGYLFTV